MVRRAYRQRSVFEVLLPDGKKLMDEALRRIDEILEDEALVEPVVEALKGRFSRSRCHGRPGTPAEVVLRLLVLKHLYDWSFDECEQQVRGSLVFRAFCRIDCESVPDAKTLIRLAQLLKTEALKGVLERLVAIATERRVTRGIRMRVDTTVVETNVRYPTDSRLMEDGVRILTRTLKRIGEKVKGGLRKVRDRKRSVARRVFELSLQSRRAGQEKVQQRMKQLYGELMGLTRAVVRDAERAIEAVASNRAKVIRGARAAVEKLTNGLREGVHLVRRVLGQTRARIVDGDTHYPEKLLSLFEPHTEAIRKGKMARPTEFGKLVKIQETEGQIITDYTVCQKRLPDQELWEPSLLKHRELFGRPPYLATADAGFASASNERQALAIGVRRVVLPARGRLSGARAQQQRQRWFRRGLRWRTGSEGRISALKRRHGLRRCRYRGEQGMERWVGLGVIANNLLVLGRRGD